MADSEHPHCRIPPAFPGFKTLRIKGKGGRRGRMDGVFRRASRVPATMPSQVWKGILRILIAENSPPPQNITVKTSELCRENIGTLPMKVRHFPVRNAALSHRHPGAVPPTCKRSGNPMPPSAIKDFGFPDLFSPPPRFTSPVRRLENLRRFRKMLPRFPFPPPQDSAADVPAPFSKPWVSPSGFA